MKFSKYNQPKKNRKKIVRNHHSREYVEFLSAEALKVSEASKEVNLELINKALSVSLNP